MATRSPRSQSSRSSVRLHDLCTDDKRKLGELLHVFTLERRKSKERITKLERDRKAYQRVVSELAKENQALSAETADLKQELEETQAELRKFEGGERGKSALGEVKSLRAGLAELSLSLKQLSSGRKDWGSTTQRNPLLLLETGRLESSRVERTPYTTGRESKDREIVYEDSLWEVLESIETGKVAISPLAKLH